MRNRLVAVAHLLDNVVDNRFFDQDSCPGLDSSRESAAGAQVDQQIGGKTVNNVLSGGRRGDFAPASMKKLQVEG